MTFGLNKPLTILEAPSKGSKGMRADTTDETNEANCLIIIQNDNTFLFNLNFYIAKINFKLPKNK